MSDLFTPLLLSVCTGLSGQYSAACKSATQATYQVSGYQATVNKFQSGATTYGKAQEKSTFGDEVWMVNTLVTAGIIVKEKKANLNLPNFGLCNSFSTQMQTNSVGFKWGWNW